LFGQSDGFENVDAFVAIIKQVLTHVLLGVKHVLACQAAAALAELDGSMADIRLNHVVRNVRHHHGDLRGKLSEGR
jgi:hypothetical protein